MKRTAAPLRHFRWIALVAFAATLAAAAQPNRPKIRIGLEEDSPPLSYLDAKGQPTGFTPELLRAISQNGNVDFEFTTSTWTYILSEFKAGRLDALANVVNTPERAKTMDFSVGHAQVHLRSYARSGKMLARHTREFAGKRVAVVDSSIIHVTVLQRGPWGATFVPCPGRRAALEAVVRGDCDFALLQMAGPANDALQLPLQNDFVEDLALTFHVAVHQGESAKLDQINEGLGMVLRDGTLDDLYAKWVGPTEPRPIRMVDLQPYLLPLILGGILLGTVLIAQHWAITQRKRAQIIAQARADELKVMTDASPALIFVAHDAQCRRITGNEAGNALMQVPKGTNISKAAPTGELHNTIRICVNGRELRPGEMPLMQAVSSGQPARDVELTFTYPDGSERQVYGHASPLFDDNGHVRGGVATFVEITERRLAERKQRESEERYRQLFDNMLNGLLVFEVVYDSAGQPANYRFLYANKAADKLTGLQLDQMRGKLGSDCGVHWPDNVLTRLYEVAATGQSIEYRRFNETLGKWYDTRVFSPRPGQFAHMFTDVSEEQAAQLKLQQSQEMLSSVLNTVPQAVFWKDLKGYFLGCNTVYARAAGLGSPAEIVGRTKLSLLSNPAEAEAFDADDLAVLKNNQPQLQLIRRLQFAGREPRWISISKLPLHDTNGQVCGILGVFEDITEKKQTDDALRESMAAMNEAQRIARMGSWRLDLATNQMVWSEELRRMSGLAPGQPLPPFEERQKLYLPESRQKLNDGLAQIRQTGGNFGIEVEVSPTGHGKRCMLVTGEAERDAQGTVVALYGTAQDITEQKLAAEISRENDRRFRLQAAALEATINAVVITNAKGTIEWVNPAFTRVTGYALAEAVGKNPRILRSGQQPKQYYVDMWRAISSGQSWSGVFVNVRKDGGLFTEEVTITPVRAEGGAITHYVAVKQDITEKLLLEKQLIETQRLESIGLLASGIAHDLNNIIAPITLSMELLRHKYPNDQRTLEMVEQCARRGADVVRQVLTFSRGMDGTRVPLRVSRLVKEMGHLMSETLPRSIEFSSDLNAPEDTVRADHTQIHQVILNLGVNARDAMPEGGKLTYTLTNETLNAPEPSIAGSPAPGPYLVIAVSDTGTGIPPEVLPRIFEPFFTTKPRGKGTGLGLSTVHGIVRSHGGFIKVQSVVGVGTTFKVYLPVVTQTEALASAASATPFATGEGRLVLVADDEPTIRDTARMVLEAQGYRVVTAENGLEAITVFQAHRGEIQHVLLDRMMPGMNGDDAAREIHHLEPKVPIILATGLVTEKNLSEQDADLKAVGITAVLRKPFTARELLRQLEQ